VDYLDLESVENLLQEWGKVNNDYFVDDHIDMRTLGGRETAKRPLPTRSRILTWGKADQPHLLIGYWPIF
jgi:hypothetical protein